MNLTVITFSHSVKIKVPVNLLGCLKLEAIHIGYDKNFKNIDTPQNVLRFIKIMNIPYNDKPKIKLIYKRNNFNITSDYVKSIKIISFIYKEVNLKLNTCQLKKLIKNDNNLKCKYNLFEYIRNKKYHPYLMFKFEEILWLLLLFIKKYNNLTQLNIKTEINLIIQDNDNFNLMFTKLINIIEKYENYNF